MAQTRTEDRRSDGERRNGLLREPGPVQRTTDQSGARTRPKRLRSFYYLNRTGYNGLCRFNQQGEFNVPFGRYKRLDYRKDFTDYIRDSPASSSQTLDFEAMPLEPTDFVYADPPYDVEFRNYSKGGFGWDEQVRTAEWLAKHPGPVVLSNQATDRIREALSEARVSTHR